MNGGKLARRKTRSARQSKKPKGISLTKRLVLMVVFTVTLTLGLFTALTVARLENGAQRQERAVSQLAWEQVSKQLRLQGSLIASELMQMRKQTADAARTVASTEETAQALKRGNIVAIDLMLQRAVKNSSLDGILAFDTDLKALGSHMPGLILPKANEEFSRSSLIAAARGLVSANDRRAPQSLTQFRPATKTALQNYGLTVTGDMLEVLSLQPVFDEFGDVTALLLAHRLVGADSPALVRFARSENLGISIHEGEKVLLNAQIEKIEHTLPKDFSIGVMGKTASGDFLYNCSNFGFNWQLCVYEPIEFLHDLVGKLVTFIKTEKNASFMWLAIFALASVTIATLTTALATARVMAPLRQITRAVHSVAKGNWMAHVAGQRRLDEVGEIARSVVVLQGSMKERERLKVDVADIDHLKFKQQVMKEAAHACRSALRHKLFGLSDMTENFDTEAKKMSTLVDLAEGEADEARLAANSAFVTLSQPAKRAETQGQDHVTGVVFDTIDRLGETVGQLSAISQTLTFHINSMSGEISQIDHIVRDFMKSMVSRSVPATTEKPKAEPYVISKALSREKA